MKVYIIFVGYKDAIAISLSHERAKRYIEKYKIKGAWIEEFTLGKKVVNLVE